MYTRQDRVPRYEIASTADWSTLFETETVRRLSQMQQSILDRRTIPEARLADPATTDFEKAERSQREKLSDEHLFPH